MLNQCVSHKAKYSTTFAQFKKKKELFNTLLSLAVNWVAYLGEVTEAIPTRVCNIFVCPNNGMAASVWDC